MQSRLGRARRQGSSSSHILGLDPRRNRQSSTPKQTCVALISTLLNSHQCFSAKDTMPPRTSPRKKATAAAVKVEKEVVQKVNGAAAKAKAKVTKTRTEAATPKKKTAGKKRKAADDTEDEDHECDSHNEAEQDGKEKPKPGPKKRKTKQEKEAEAMPLAGRTAVSSLKRAMYIGAHVSGAGG